MTNGEKYKTTEERANAFYKYCYGYKRCVGCIMREQYENPFMCSFHWLDLEAEEEKLLPCPFCGVPVRYDDEKECIECFCGYRSTSVSGKNVTIEAHNRICRAAMAAKEMEVAE